MTAPERHEPVVVVGFDGSTTSEHALHYAIGLAGRQGASVLAVHVLSAPYDPFWASQAAADPTVRSGLQETVKDVAAHTDVPVTFTTAFGDPAAVLSRIATDRRADAIVVGASTAAVHKFFGSTAVRTVRNCPCPVTVVP